MENRERQPEIINMSKEEVIHYIIERYGEEIKRLIFTYVKSYAQTDDLFQEFLINTYKGLDRFHEQSSLKTWLYRIAINKCKDYLRSPFHRLFHFTDMEPLSKRDKSAEQVSMEREQQHQVVEAILSLPIKYREVVILKYYKDMSIQEIGQMLGTNESTIKSRIMRGKEILKKRGEDIFE
ncbi:sigma-70 family RNA polymerase sigma factor [Bacillus sp. BGMRC 2118]|nr:sigma-70 family RNA polymerase sigma factor [Bacillus sp. BGMRC 2118]